MGSGILVLAQLPKAQKTDPFWGPHFGAGKPLLSSFLELQNLDTDREIPSNAHQFFPRCSWMSEAPSYCLS